LLVLAGLVAWWWWRQSPAEAFQVTLSILVVTCPCALSLATPAALVAATGSLTKRGLLTTRGHALETLARATHIIFDKTGTLTYGKLQLSDIRLMGSSDRETCLAIAAALESGSEHPIAKAILEKTQHIHKASDVEAIPGKGIEGIVDSRKYRIGTIEYICEHTDEPVVPDSMQGMTTVALADHAGILALFSFADQPREEAEDTITQIKELGLTVTLLSGDNQHAVGQIARQLGIEEAHANMLPRDKLEYLRVLQQQGAIVAMVGDGVNDAPVLAGAQVSMAMGGGTQLAHASADMVLLSEHLVHIADGIRTSRKTLRIIRQNLAWAVVYNLVALPLAAAGMVAPWMAAIGMSASSLMVVLNSLRLSTRK
jgi:Cu2+-exporting ATPase